MRVLLVENQKPMAQALKRHLEGEGCAVDAASKAADGDRKVRSRDYDAIILDLRLPREEGFTLLQRWRQNGLTSHVLVLIGRGARVEERVRTLDAGADAYMTKPFYVAELLARLRALFRRNQPGGDSVLRAHDLEINTAARTVRRAGRPIQLTPREYALLELLARHRGRVVTRAMVWDALYDEYDANTSNVVDVYIRYLRNKIDKGFDPPLILTRWGEGYLLRGEAG